MPPRLLTVPLVLGLAALACTSTSKTGIVVDVSTNCTIPTEIDELLIRVVTTSGKALPEVRRALAATQSAGDLGRLGLAPSQDPPYASTVDIEAVGLRAKVEVVSRRARQSFIKDEVIVVKLELLRECLGKTCGRDLTCDGRQGQPTCVMPPSEMGIPTGDGGASDASVPARDASDASAPAMEGPRPDAGTGAEPPRDPPATDAPVDLRVDTPVPPIDVAPESPAPMPDVPVTPPPDTAPVLRPQGATCQSGGQCTSGACVDEICCNRACGEICSACRNDLTGGPSGECRPVSAGRDPHDSCTMQAAATCGLDGFCDGAGSCRRHLPGTMCAMPTCQGNSFVPTSTCSAAGACSAPAGQPCGLFVCSPTGCIQSCQADQNCVDDAYCDAGTCKEKKPLASLCSRDRECKSGRCLQGILNLICT